MDYDLDIKINDFPFRYADENHINKTIESIKNLFHLKMLGHTLDYGEELVITIKLKKNYGDKKI